MLSLKKQINRYWTQRAPDFSALRKAELASPKGQLWRDELLQFLPNAKHAQTPIRVLDIGTGSGFFAFLLEPLGYSVTGIDLSDAMIEQARVWARSLNSRVAFHCMDAENPRFADQTFDVLITRNLTWTLPDLPAAYRNWKRLLRPNGVLVNFDADYSHSPHNTVHSAGAHEKLGTDLMQKHRVIQTQLARLQPLRPQWDRTLLLQAGFRDIDLDTTVGERLYRDKDDFYNPDAVFCITARA